MCSVSVCVCSAALLLCHKCKFFHTILLLLILIIIITISFIFNIMNE